MTASTIIRLFLAVCLVSCIVPLGIAISQLVIGIKREFGKRDIF